VWPCGPRLVAAKCAAVLIHTYFTTKSNARLAMKERTLYIEGDDQDRARDGKLDGTANASRVLELPRPLTLIQEEDPAMRLRISETRMRYAKSRKPCRCGHGTAIHRVLSLAASSGPKRKHPCNFPGCKCSNYKAIKQPEPLPSRNERKQYNAT